MMFIQSFTKILPLIQNLLGLYTHMDTHGHDIGSLSFVQEVKQAKMKTERNATGI